MPDREQCVSAAIDLIAQWAADNNIAWGRATDRDHSCAVPEPSALAG